jgi:Flp pilus assembly protein CpaB
MTYSVRNIVIALVLAAVAAGMVILYTGNVKKQAHDSQQNVTVVVAKTAIAGGSPTKELIDTGAFETRQVVQRDVVPGAFTSVDSLNKNLATAGPITAGSQITPSMFTEGTSAPITSQIKNTMRAVQVAYNPNRVLDGTLHAGDHVDVIAAFEVKSSLNNSPYTEQDASRVLMTNVQVLSTKADGVAATALQADSDTTGGTGSSDGTQGAAIILAIPQDQIAAFNLARQFGQLWYVVRPTSGAQDTNTVVATPCSVLGAGLSLTQIKSYLPVCIAKGVK